MKRAEILKARLRGCVHIMLCFIGNITSKNDPEA